jgi:chromosomal replication initiation ATPase DnaA
MNKNKTDYKKGESLIELINNSTGLNINIESRKDEVICYRLASMVYLKRYTMLTLNEIGHLFGGKNHATVLNAIKYHDRNLISKKKRGKHYRKAWSLINSLGSVSIELSPDQKKDFEKDIEALWNRIVVLTDKLSDLKAVLEIKNAEIKDLTRQIDDLKDQSKDYYVKPVKYSRKEKEANGMTKKYITDNFTVGGIRYF